MKSKSNNPFPDPFVGPLSGDAGNVMVVGKPGAGKTLHMSEIISAVSGDTRKRNKTVRTIKANNPFRMNLKK
ncbi:DNA/RNA helicase domain-containing protein [Klebsiella sp. A-Nf5]|uniref:DNA/RNA helicase domain-containing protein n=1 Tax=Klebsiella sp. A-Nf5 TaxID=2054608 RepID=UPI0010546224|nr:DNA/RNA helicase domain-containing protein [Klebsiella sp. A-Nf5]